MRTHHYDTHVGVTYQLSTVLCQIQDEFGEKATTLITELIRDNREIIDRIPKAEIDKIVGFVKQHRVSFCFAVSMLLIGF